MQKNNKKRKIKWIIYSYRIISIILILLLLFLLKVIVDNKKPTIVKKEIINPNVVMLGDSITDFYDLDKYYGSDKLIVNSGINGNKTDDIINNIRKRVYAYNPSKLFLLIGVNDILYDDASPEKVIDQIDIIANEVNQKLPNTKIYIESIYPVNNTWKNEHDNRLKDEIEINETIVETNKLIEQYCIDNDYKYIDVYSSLTDVNNKLDGNYSNDGLHPNDNGYEIITKILKKYM
jgi:lysophospholipase L1-like esterase